MNNTYYGMISDPPCAPIKIKRRSSGECSGSVSFRALQPSQSVNDQERHVPADTMTLNLGPRTSTPKVNRKDTTQDDLDTSSLSEKSE